MFYKRKTVITCYYYIQYFFTKCNAVLLVDLHYFMKIRFTCFFLYISLGTTLPRVCRMTEYCVAAGKGGSVGALGHSTPTYWMKCVNTCGGRQYNIVTSEATVIHGRTPKKRSGMEFEITLYNNRSVGQFTCVWLLAIIYTYWCSALCKPKCYVK